MESIIKKYLEGSASGSEREKLLKWIRKKENRASFNQIKSDWKKNLEKNTFFSQGEETWSKLQSDLWQKSYTRLQHTRKIQMFFKYAAIIFFIVSIGGFVWYFMNQPKSQQIYYTSVVAEKGHISKVNLPDGTVVWLNSGSELTYNNLFAQNNREIDLEGEAFFDVTKNPEIPLFVNCDDLTVKVLGTRFNVLAYKDDEHIDVILEEGAVEIKNSKVSTFQYDLKPGELAKFNKSSRELFVSKVNPVKYTSWKEGILNIYDQPMAEVVNKLTMRFNQNFEYSKEIENLRYTFTIKNESLEDVIKLMEKITPVYAVQNNGVIYLKPDKNKIRDVDKH